MTQFVVVTRRPGQLTPPPRMCALELEPSLRALASGLFPEHIGDCSKIVESESGEADPLFDALFNDSPDGDGTALLDWLEELVGDGCGVAMWCGVDAEDLPKYEDWKEFKSAVREDASKQPPEVYAIMQAGRMS